MNKITAEAQRMDTWVLGAFWDKYVVTVIIDHTVEVPCEELSKLKYYCQMWNPTKIGNIQLTENVQKQFTR